ncbi:2'-5' RNA ligase [Clostridium saccharoperbutylacetonicum]|uniref:2'-5' RNA ligase superfamily n=1 Tax=Clostridium saccharoperbutylacetonicum N1-4(HMT) TaxID=931276 RepID=M1MNG9_9CLOT|nr:2'-5' RNA ligase family protein [Clostridium saccharoperbutylacetonicum]AGF56246.1 2'-5' RNA ligase superfamily [Clostridium saccharoperbutylacetonicum N1-4(HMT)]NRT63011.1 2'-5' RNA ligase [Clostridium saccharoperbutylacetonicum]NSB26368.1 2'-5' RNA ligase [Clostridium saccharoperbutylacetonicum]NSB45721.1 2'-5' RNA ligase [Clostridium saccharoperbutylacetonicum]
MRYVIVCVIKGKAGDFNNNLRKELFNKFKAKSSKLPAHFTIKAPFEHDKGISDLIKVLEDFSENEKGEVFKIDGYDHFDDRVIYMKVAMSDEAKNLHDKLIDTISKIPYIEFDKNDGKDKTFHVTLASKKLKSIFSKVWEYIQKYPCEFNCSFNNVTIYKWEEGTWKVYREFTL